MKFLVTNDDGIYSSGLRAAVEALRGLGEVVVVAPDREQSGIGTAITLHAPIRANPLPPTISGLDGVTTYAVEGTPADSVILALEKIIGPVDLLVSGINNGANLGEDVLVSGTVGAALQGYLRGVTSIAISVTALRDVHYGVATRLLKALVGRLSTGSLPRPLLLNINLPNLPLERIEGLEVTRMGRRSFMEVVQEGEDGRRKYYWIARSRPLHEEIEGTDVWAVRHSRISLTPLGTHLTALEQMPALEGLCRELGRHLLGDLP
jgi:5'-nucleotidase